MISIRMLHRAVLKRLLRLRELMLEAEKEKDTIHALQYENKIFETERILSLLMEQCKPEDYVG